MKLNAGCGYNKIEGYINIDINADVKPDYVMDVCYLDFEDETFNEVLAKDVVEHLGYFRTKYFLSEAFRVLRKDKFLIIETPDIEKTFKLFLEACNQIDREKILGWVYGSETKYMSHKYCYPVELMESLLIESGFEVYKKEFFNYDHLRPSVRYISIKVKREKEKSIFRRLMVKNGVLNIEDEIYLSEFEKVINSINFTGIESNDIIDYTFTSPIISLSLNELRGKIVDLEMLKALKERNFTGWIFNVMLKYYRDFRERKKAYEVVKNMFFDNPFSFIYNFIENKRKSDIKIPLLNETTFNYMLNIKGIKI